MRQNDVQVGDFVKGPWTYFTICVAADHKNSDSYDDVVKSKYPNLLNNMR